MKRFLLLITLISAQQLFAETLIQYYIPSYFGFVSGGGAVFNQFKDSEADKHFILPFEVRKPFAHYQHIHWKNTQWEEYFIFSFIANGRLSFYFEDSRLSSINISLGITLTDNSESKHTSLTGALITIYPLYEFPVLSFGKQALLPYKIAIDFFSLSLCLQPHIPLYFSAYFRMIGFIPSLGYALDFGLTVGWIF